MGAPMAGTMVGWVEVRESVTAPGRVVARYGPTEGTFLMAPRWRPNSNEILLFYATGAGMQERRELVVADGVAGTRRAIATATEVRSADWTADGKRILYASFNDVRLIDADGSGDSVAFRPAPPSGREYVFIAGVAAFGPAR